jgi:HSP90 family molecular chaperone
MKLEQVAVNNTSNFAGETFEGAIDVTKLSSILSLLIRNYNSPELATLREWVSNAHDSHKEAGVSDRSRSRYRASSPPHSRSRTSAPA